MQSSCTKGPPDTKRSAYVLPIKATVRKRAQLQAGVTAEVLLVVDL